MASVNYAKVVKDGTFLSDYLTYSSNSETPIAYDFWTGLWLLSCALGRDIVVARPGAPVYLNIYAVLVAESGITRKSTAVRRAVRFARHLCGDRNLLVESKITPEKLEFDLAMQSVEFGTSRASIAIDEMVKFLGRERYVEQMPTLLTDLYDCPDIRSGGGTLLRGSATLRNVHINFLSASTPSWLLRAVNPDVIEGGFTSRVLFIVAERPKRSLPFPERQDIALETSIHECLSRLHDEATRIGSIAVSEGAKKKFSSWYRSRDIKRDPFRASFQSREDSHVLRCAALLAVNDRTWEIQNHHVIHAIRIITEVREDGASIFEGTGANSKIVMGVDAIRDKLLACGINGVKQSELTKHLQRFMDAEHTRTALNIMHELGMVQQFQNIQVGKGRPTTIWRAKASLTSSKAIDNVIEALGPTG